MHLADAAAPQEIPRGAAGKTQSRFPAAMQQVRIFQSSKKREAGVHPRGIFVAGSQETPRAQRGQANFVDVGKTRGGFSAGAAGPVATQSFRAMALGRDRPGEDRATPTEADKNSQAS